MSSKKIVISANSNTASNATQRGVRKILLFAKAPMLGQVKTRMMPVLTPEQCLELHRDLLATTLGNCLAAQGVVTELWVSQSHNLFQTDRYSLLKKCRQQGADLGEKMAYACGQALDGAESVLLLGADCPLVTPAAIVQAFNSLERGNELCLIPADDGGYAAMALREVHSALFENIQWGGAQVLSQTLDAANSLGLAYELLPSVTDIDRPEDLPALALNPLLAHWSTFALL